MHLDRFAHLRESLATMRAHTAHLAVTPWCRACEVHLAATVGDLCPVCAPDVRAA